MPTRINPPLPTRTHDLARSLRQSSNEAEQALWHRLRAGRLGGLKFRRQHPIPPYVVDFHCGASRMVVEVDGSHHTEELDRARTRFLEGQGLRVLRFWDNEVLRRPDAVLEVILEVARGRTLTPTPLPPGEGPRSEKR